MKNVLDPKVTANRTSSNVQGGVMHASLLSKKGYRIVMALLPLVALLILAAIPAIAEQEPKCPTQTEKGDPACWMEVEKKPGCFIWNPFPKTDETVTWSGSCSGGFPDGHGTETWICDDYCPVASTGRYVNGKRNGVWSEESDAGTAKGPYVDGKRNGVWSEESDAGTAKGPYVDGKRNGEFVIKEPDGTIWVSNLVDDEMHGETTLYIHGECLLRQTWVYGHMTLKEPC